MKRIVTQLLNAKIATAKVMQTIGEMKEWRSSYMDADIQECFRVLSRYHYNMMRHYQDNLVSEEKSYKNVINDENDTKM